jgi:hypothetical protein
MVWFLTITDCAPGQHTLRISMSREPADPQPLLERPFESQSPLHRINLINEIRNLTFPSAGEYGIVVEIDCEKASSRDDPATWGPCGAERASEWVAEAESLVTDIRKEASRVAGIFFQWGPRRLGRIVVAQQFLRWRCHVKPFVIRHFWRLRFGRSDARRVRWVCAGVRGAFFRRRLRTGDTFAARSSETFGFRLPGAEAHV